jgi:GT2 family glycosyltransferase
LTLNSILEKTRYPNYNIIVVDNGGREDIRNLLGSVADRHPTKVITVFNDQNMGFSAGNNIGIDLATGSDYIVLLNDDVMVTPGWLGRLIWHLRDNSIGMVGPVTNSIANEACIEVDYTNLSDIDSFARRYHAEHEGQLFDIAVLAMYCVVLRKEVVDTIGRLDERFGAGMFEDDDYAVRLRKAGYRVMCAEDVFVHHFGRSSFSKMEDEEYRKLFEANRALFEQKWGSVWQEHKYRDGYQPGEWQH